ncbi:hypothetical protein ST47_g4538 [Ascochyta rabiei]|uniref:Rhodopsin domain-containing protein n=1 Tax=Didymella rabiei TaxID=5454 RepID=A0A163FFL1_DIDRA|nr:hypothetical protein ST47_g4538 [Ascochyta rabiei]
MTSRFPTAEELLSFPKPNYVDPTTRRPLAIGIITPMTVLVVVFMSCRLYSRTVLTKTLGWDDGIMLLAAVMSVGNNIMVIISMLPQYQMGYHLWDIRPQILYASMKAAQVAIFLTYLRIFPSRLNKWFCGIMLCYTVSLNVACFFVTLFQCSPASTYWNIFKYLGRAKCLNIKAIYYFHSVQNTLSDFLIFLWPAKDLLNVKVSLRQRVTLICMFSFGVIVCIAGAARLYYTHIYLHSYDVFWHGAETFIIMSAESCVGIVCGCFPGCKPMLNRLFPQYFRTTNNSSNQYPLRVVEKVVHTTREPNNSPGWYQHTACKPSPIRIKTDTKTSYCQLEQCANIRTAPLTITLDAKLFRDYDHCSATPFALCIATHNKMGQYGCKQTATEAANTTGRSSSTENECQWLPEKQECVERAKHYQQREYRIVHSTGEGQQIRQVVAREE